MQEVILHVGMDKTGTTSLQASLKGFDDGDTVYSRLPPNQSLPFDTLFSDNFKTVSTWAKRGIHGDEIDRIRNEYLTVLESETSRKDRRRLVYCAENAWRASEGEKIRMVSFFESRGLKLKVFCYVRDVVDFGAAFFQQSVKNGSTIEISPIEVNLRNRLESLRTILPPDEFIVKKYSRSELHCECVVQDFCRAIGITPIKVKITNEGLSSDAIRLIYHFNIYGPIAKFDKRLLDARREMIRALSEAYTGPKMSSHHFEGLIPGIDDDYKYLAEHFSIFFPEQKRRNDSCTLDDLMSNISDIDLSPLDRLLHLYDIDSRLFLSAVDKMTVLFYAILAGFNSKWSLKRFKRTLYSRNRI